MNKIIIYRAALAGSTELKQYVGPPYSRTKIYAARVSRGSSS